MYIGMRFHLYIFFTMFCVHSFFVFLFVMPIRSPTVVSQHLSKSNKRGWLTRWPPRFFAKPIWHSTRVCLHWSAIVPLCFHLLKCSLVVGLLHAMAFMVLLLVGWVIWNNKPLPFAEKWCFIWEFSRGNFGGFSWGHLRSASKNNLALQNMMPNQFLAEMPMFVDSRSV